MFQKIIFIFLFVFLNISVFADEFVVLSFTEDISDLAARENEKRDQNDKPCALIKISTDLTELTFESNRGIVATEYKTGEYWIFLSAGTSQLKIGKTKFMLLSYNIPIPINQSTVYKMKLTNKEKGPVAEAQPEFVLIKSTPDKAKVSINGELKGNTPINNLALFPGTYKYKIEKENYYPEEGDLTVETGKKATINSTLKPKFGTLIIDVKNVQGVTVLINDIETGQQTPFKNEQYSSGTYNLALRKNNYYDIVKSFTVNDGLTTTISEEMKPKFGSITITSTPETNADIILDNVKLNQKTPYLIPVVLSGSHTVEVQKEMFESATQSFVAQDGQTATITIPMKPVFGDVTINTQPIADIYLDKQKIGNGTISTRVVSGVHLLETKKDKYSDALKTIDVKVNTKETYLLEPKPKTGIISVVTNPAEAEIWLDGENKGNSPLFLRNILIGTYNLELKLSGYSTVKKTFSVEENKTTEVNETLPQGEQITINTTPVVAKIMIDGGTEINTPYKGILSYGNHSIVAIPIVSGYLTTNDSITIVQGEKTSFVITIDYTETTAGLNIDMVYVQGGTFTMGCTEQGSDCYDNEKPAHSVTLDGFYIAKTEVTQLQWKSIMGSNPSNFSGCDQCPVEQVSWDNAQDFITKLNQKTGKKYSLPTEAQWEYAARGGNKSSGYKYSGSNNIDEVAWYNSNSSSKTHPVGQKKANELGLYDMSGNVWEWCSDWHGTYSSNSQTNPQGTTIGSGRVLRGGGWGRDARGCRVSDRYYNTPGSRYYYYGFRLVCVP